MGKSIFVACVCLIGIKTCCTLPGPDPTSAPEASLPEECYVRLQSFANETATFTLCVITHSRPVTVCEDCVNEYNGVLARYEDIRKLKTNDSQVDCRAVLTNIDRLQVVYASYSYVLDMWDRASCKLCLNDTVLDGRAKEVMKRARFLKACISNHNNGTELNFTLCSDCKNDYDELTNYYNRQKINSEFCMDVIDLINSTQTEWSSVWKCHVPNHKSEWVLLVISFTVLLMSVLFYFINWLLSQERSNVLLSQNRWPGRFTNSAASTSGYVVIS